MTRESDAQAGYSDFEFAALQEAKNYRAALMHYFNLYLRGNVLEVGAGIGQITAELRRTPAIKKLTSIEPDAALCHALHSRFPDHQLLHGTVHDLRSEVTWNAIVSINVLGL